VRREGRVFKKKDRNGRPSVDGAILASAAGIIIICGRSVNSVGIQAFTLIAPWPLTLVHCPAAGAVYA
jgi:hypothetical protein